MTDSEFDCTIEGKQITFYHNTKTHQYDILVDGEMMVFTKAKGKAIIDFLKKLEVMK